MLRFIRRGRPQKVRRPKFCLFFRTQASTASKSQKAEILFVFSDSSINIQRPQRRKEKVRKVVVVPFLAWTVNFADQKCFFFTFIRRGRPQKVRRPKFCLFFRIKYQQPQRVRRLKFCLFFRTQASTASKDRFSQREQFDDKLSVKGRYDLDAVVFENIW
jgi:hypothetical protein